ncbi:alkaline phosphatase family protein [Halorientalis regularis]|jgi:hypothetical protein|uniref:Sulfatase n=1 Tax=Halorientalis regularis TaxID=660518 RepID=A0A1G7GU02_9EURY|nr:hypothetical protein [Halorientalis regularis]SDE91581.1 hypothetical protein SAMN05216218_102183 [Halorientalis regularis]
MFADDAGRGPLQRAFLRAIQAVGRRLDYGTHVYDHEWDLLVVLDSCRPDALATVGAPFPFVDEIDRRRSVGSCSSEWLTRTFGAERADAVAETAMVTGNTWTDRYLDADAFAALDEVWKYAWDDDIGTVRAAAITDRAVALARNRNPERLVVHYMQPHHPFVPDPVTGDAGMARTGNRSSDTNPWVALRRGEVSVERVWRAYEANLRYALESVGVLLDNVTADRAVITADHANLLGEWGLYGHPMHAPVPALVTVPWVETEGRDRGTFDPTLSPPEPLPVGRVYGTGDATDRLAALGYR